MSDTATVSGGVQPANYSDALGAAANFETYFGSGSTYSVVLDSGVDTVTGSLVIGGTGTSQTISGASNVDDANSGGHNAFTVTSPATFLASQGDTISAASAATTIFGSAVGTTTFSLGGAGSSVTGGSGTIMGTSSGANTTLVGGNTTALFTLTGSNSLAVAGRTGTTGVNESQSTGPETIATNPLGNSGTLIATLGSGADTVVGGSGASTITAGSGNDVFAFVKGHAGGSEVIIGFNAADNLAFGGYGYSSSITPTETLTAAGDQITLSDGTTITFAGVDHKLFSA